MAVANFDSHSQEGGGSSPSPRIKATRHVIASQGRAESMLLKGHWLKMPFMPPLWPSRINFRLGFIFVLKAARTKMDPYSLVGDSSSLFGRNFKSKGVLESHCDGLSIYALTVLVALHQHQEKYRQRGLGILFLFSRSPVGVHGNFFILMYRHQNS